MYIVILTYFYMSAFVLILSSIQTLNSRAMDDFTCKTNSTCLHLNCSALCLEVACCRTNMTATGLINNYIICTQCPFPPHFCVSNILCILAVIFTFIFMCITLLYGADVLSFQSNCTFIRQYNMLKP